MSAMKTQHRAISKKPSQTTRHAIAAATAHGHGHGLFVLPGQSLLQPFRNREALGVRIDPQRTNSGR